MSMKTVIVNPAEWMNAAMPLIEANWAETGFDYDFKPDVSQYARLYELGMCFAVAALYADTLVGYCTVVVVGPLHNPEHVTAVNDGLFVDPVYRNGRAAYLIMQAAEREAHARGAKEFMWCLRPGTPIEHALLKRGCFCVEHKLVKLL